MAKPTTTAQRVFDIGMDDYICQTVLPYGLAAQLLMDENPTATPS